MKLEDLYETPQKIGDIDDHLLNNRASNANLAYKYLADKRKVLIKELADKVGLYELPQNYIVIDERTNPPKIIYYVKYEVQNLGYLGRKAASQVLVWRSVGFKETRGLPSRIFFDYILPKTGTIVTDYLQTNEGERFWGDRVGDALSEGNFVYYVNFLPPRVIQQIKHIDELRSIRDIVWGEHQKYRQRRIIITNQQLKVQGE